MFRVNVRDGTQKNGWFKTFTFHIYSGKIDTFIMSKIIEVDCVFQIVVRILFINLILYLQRYN